MGSAFLVSLHGNPLRVELSRDGCGDILGYICKGDSFTFHLIFLWHWTLRDWCVTQSKGHLETH